jgi:hypothetical protein
MANQLFGKETESHSSGMLNVSDSESIGFQ